MQNMIEPLTLVLQKFVVQINNELRYKLKMMDVLFKGHTDVYCNITAVVGNANITDLTLT